MHEPSLDTTLIVPCFNEAERLQLDAFTLFIEQHPYVQFIFVDDGSSDDTRHVLQEFSAAHPRQAEVLALARNCGKGEAVRQGMLRGLSDPKTFIGYWDADLATPLAAVDDFRAVLRAEEALQMVFGSRVKLLGREIQRSPVRHYLGRVFATVVSGMLRLPIYDTQCGAKLFRVSPSLNALFSEPFISRWVFDVEILARDICERRAESSLLPTQDIIYEYPLHQWTDVAGSKIAPTDFLLAFRDIVRIYRKYFLGGAAIQAASQGATNGRP